MEYYRCFCDIIVVGRFPDRNRFGVRNNNGKRFVWSISMVYGGTHSAAFPCSRYTDISKIITIYMRAFLHYSVGILTWPCDFCGSLQTGGRIDFRQSVCGFSPSATAFNTNRFARPWPSLKDARTLFEIFWLTRQQFFLTFFNKKIWHQTWNFSRYRQTWYVVFQYVASVNTRAPPVNIRRRRSLPELIAIRLRTVKNVRFATRRACVPFAEFTEAGVRWHVEISIIHAQ